MDEHQAGWEARWPKALSIINPATLHDRPIPERTWIVEGWLAPGHVTVFYAPGGVGKSQLAMQLMTAAAVTGSSWCGLAVSPCRSLALFCEDDADELHRRQARINAASGLDFADLEAIRWSSGVGQDNALARFAADNRMSVAQRFRQVEAAARDHRAQLVILDTAADVFAGNENDRNQVRQFIGLLNRLAMDLGAAVLLNAHPSRSGMSSAGDMDGGSTAWSNSARSRWSLSTSPKDSDGQGDNAIRILTRRKSNYAAAGESIRLRWEDGVLVPADRPAGLFGTIERRAVEEVFLTLLDRCVASNMSVSHSKNASNFAPRVFAQRPDAEGYTSPDFGAAMSRLFAEKRIRVADYGRPSDTRQRLARTQEGAE